jgi:hypothetical protein
MEEVAPAMSNESSVTVPAGWYPDPAGSFQQRWWNGTAWTNDFAQYRPSLVHAPATTAGHGAHAVSEAVAAQQAAHHGAHQASPVRESESPAAAAYAAQTAASQSAATQTLTREPSEPAGPARVDPLPTFTLPAADQAPMTTVAQPNAASAVLVPVRAPATPSPFDSFGGNTGFGTGYQPLERRPEVRAGVRQKASRAHSLSAWLLAVLPILFFAGAIVLAFVAVEYYTVIALAVVAATLLVTSFALAAHDSRVLTLDGHFETASPAWVFLTPVAYLIVRTASVARETGRVVPWPLLTALVVYAGILTAVYFAPVVSPLLLGVTPL